MVHLMILSVTLCSVR